MPSLDSRITGYNRKGLLHREVRSARIQNIERATAIGRMLLDLRHAERHAAARIEALAKPVKRQVGEQVVEIHDDQGLATMIRALIAVTEQRRVLLRVPGPGRDTLGAKIVHEMPAAIPVDVQELIESVKSESGGGVNQTVGGSAEPSS